MTSLEDAAAEAKELQEGCDRLKEHMKLMATQLKGVSLALSQPQTSEYSEGRFSFIDEIGDQTQTVMPSDEAVKKVFRQYKEKAQKLGNLQKRLKNAIRGTGLDR